MRSGAGKRREAYCFTASYCLSRIREGYSTFVASDHWAKGLGDQRVPQTLGPSQTHERHVKLGKGVARERNNKGYTREHGGVEGMGMRATGRGVSKTPTNTTLEPLYYTVVQQYTT